jgi:hypothetical protein
MNVVMTSQAQTGGPDIGARHTGDRGPEAVVA